MGLFRRKWRLVTCIIAVLAIAVWLTTEFHYPAEIVSKPIVLPGGIKAFGTPNLMMQHISKEAAIWSVRGHWVYKSFDGFKFGKAFKVPSGNLISWLGNFRFIRALTGYTELCEVFPLRSGTILAFSGGYIWRSTERGNIFRQVHKLRHFGMGHGRGVMPQGMAEDNYGAFYYGEYFRNLDRDPVSVYRSLDDGKNWEVAHRFKAGQIRHIHSLQFDPYTKALWITTGDRDHESMIAYSIDKGVTFQNVGSGSQKWRAVSLLFTEDAVFWGTDSPHSQNWVYRLDRETHGVQQVCKVGGPIYYSTKLFDGTLILGRTVEGGKGEWDDVVSIWLSKGGKRWIKIPFGKRKRFNRQAVLRFARGKSAADLFTTGLNTNHYEETLLKIPIKNIMR
ncbi:MAG: hypothetical protein ACFFCW_31005 [Candidatus Hodarchaeota archaeon]